LLEKHIDHLLNVTVTIMAEQPKIAPHRDTVIASLATVLGVDKSQVAVAAGTNERFDAVGRGEALACFAHVLLVIRGGTGASPVATQSRTRPAPTRAPQQAVPSSATGGGAHATEDPDLPHRVQEFERAVKTKLVPLPKAPPPSAGAELILYTDGASRGNPGPAASGWVLFDAQGLVVHEQGSHLGQLTNNEAEYAALMEALNWMEANLGTDFRLTVRMDSELVVKQLRGEYKVKAEHLRQTALLAMAALAAFTDLRLEHVPRAQNARADALANQALDARLKS